MTQPTDLCKCGHARSAHSEDYGNACFAEIRIWKTCHCLSFTPQPESEARNVHPAPEMVAPNAGESSDPTPPAKAHKGYQNTFERIWDESDYSLPPEPQPVDPVQESTVEGTLSAMEEWVSGIRDSTDAERNAIDECLAEELAQPVDGKEEHPIIERVLSDFAQEVIKTQKERIVALELESDGYAVREKTLREWLAKVDVALATMTKQRGLAHEQTKRELESVRVCFSEASDSACKFGHEIDVLKAERDDLARQLAEAKESLEWANKTVDGQRETMTKAIEGASSAEKRNDSLTRQLAEQQAIAARMREAITALLPYSGCHCLDCWERGCVTQECQCACHTYHCPERDEARAATEANAPAALTQLVKAAFEEGWASGWGVVSDQATEAMGDDWLSSDAFRALGKASE